MGKRISQTWEAKTMYKKVFYQGLGKDILWCDKRYQSYIMTSSNCIFNILIDDKKLNTDEISFYVHSYSKLINAPFCK